MSRSVPEWIGKTDDTPAPRKVKLRIADRQGNRCACGCNVEVREGDTVEYDHIRALADGGENRESNLQMLLTAHHKKKTKAEAPLRAKARRLQAARLGLKSSPSNSGLRAKGLKWSNAQGRYVERASR